MAKLNLAALAAVLSFAIIPALAQSASSVKTLHLPNFDKQTILASIITAGPTATAYLLTCPTADPNYDDTECGLGTGIRVLEGPSTLAVYLDTGDESDNINCAIINSNTAACTDVMRSVDQDGKTQASSTTSVFTRFKQWEMPVTITGGLAAVTSGGSGTGSTQASPNPTSSGTGSAQTTSTGSASTGTESPQTTDAPTSTGGVPRATGNAVIAGIAAVFGGVLMI